MHPEASPPSCIFESFQQQRGGSKHLSEAKRSESFSLNATDRYYHSRAARNTAPTSAPSASATQPQITDGLTDETEAERPGPSAPPRSPAPSAPLPSFMRGVHVFFYNLPASERKRLARYLITYPFRLTLTVLQSYKLCFLFLTSCDVILSRRLT